MSDSLNTILDPATIRLRTARIFDEALAGRTAFSVHLDKLDACVDLVMQVTHRNYPDARIPYHGRFEHFRVGGIDRVAALLPRLSPDPIERARALIDLVVVSVLLDAGAGNAWKFNENGTTYTRSEGLALASLAMFERGAFSGTKALRVDLEGLKELSLDDVKRGFQVGSDNPLLAVEGRAALINRLGASVAAFPEFFPLGRPGSMLDVLMKNGSVHATELLRVLLLGLSRMWPARVTVERVGFGDVWPHQGQLVPFHKLSQWLAYSLIEPIENAGVRVEGVDALTGLPEYRNGGLFLDTGVLALRDPYLAQVELEAGHPAIIEWRALTVQLLDRVGADVCRRLGRTSAELPLARVLQGGTWSAGREIARRLRPGGVPPLTLKSDGMVF